MLPSDIRYIMELVDDHSKLSERVAALELAVKNFTANNKQSTPCPMCGHPCTIGGDDKEGTHYYIPQ